MGELIVTDARMASLVLRPRRRSGSVRDAVAFSFRRRPHRGGTRPAGTMAPSRSDEEFLRLTYFSRSQLPPDVAAREKALKDIFDRSMVHNARAGITGQLLYNQEFFVQTLEGPRDAVERLLDKIVDDPRHIDVVVVRAGLHQTRRFHAWSMLYLEVPGTTFVEAMTAPWAMHG